LTHYNLSKLRHKSHLLIKFLHNLQGAALHSAADAVKTGDGEKWGIRIFGPGLRRTQKPNERWKVKSLILKMGYLHLECK